MVTDDTETGGKPQASQVCLDPPVAVVDAYSDLKRRTDNAPLHFSFTWRQTAFDATVEAGDDGLRLTLKNNLGALPFSAEDKNRRADLLAIVDADKDSGAARLKIVRGQDIVLEGGFPLIKNDGNMANNIVSTLTTLVLRAAPHLDLLAENASSFEGLPNTPNSKTSEIQSDLDH